MNRILLRIGLIATKETGPYWVPVRSWRSRMMQRIELADRDSWQRQEEKNWRALWLRATDA